MRVQIVVETVEVHCSVCILYDLYDDCLLTHGPKRGFISNLLHFGQTDAIEVCSMMLLTNLCADCFLFML